MKSLIINLILIASIVGCVPPQENDTLTQEKELSFESIENGMSLIITPTKNKTYIIEDNIDWKDLWDEVYGDQPQKPLLPQVDFTKYSIIAVFQGTKNTGGYTITITKIIEMENNLKIFVKDISPSKNCMVIQSFTSPYHIVKIQRVDKEVEFIIDKEIVNC